MLRNLQKRRWDAAMAGAGAAAAAAIPWYLSGGILLSDVAAVWESAGAVSLDTSYQRVAGDQGNSDLDPSVVGGTAPWWTEIVGWVFSGAGLTHLLSGIVAGSNWSVIARFSDANGGALFGADSASNRRFYLWPYLSGTQKVYGGGGYVIITNTAFSGGTIGISGRQGYFNGVADGTTTNADYSDVPQWQPLIGSMTNAGDNLPSLHFSGCLQDLAIYKRALNDTEFLAVHNAVSSYIYSRVDVAVSGQNATILVPQNYSAVSGAPLIIFHHGMGEGQTAVIKSPTNEALGKFPVILALLKAGYIIACTNAHGDNWGNDDSISDYQNLYDYCVANYNITRVCAWSESMGGLSGLSCLAANDPPYKGWLGTYPACSLHWCYDNGYTASIKTAYGIASDGSDYDAKTAGNDPLLMSGTLFDDRMCWYASPDDTAMNKVNNTDAMHTLVESYATEHGVVVCTGQHGNASHFQPADYVNFFNRCI